jgi:hypothetical protein
MAETPDKVFKRGCCPNTTGASLPAREYLPGDGIHHFDFRSTCANWAAVRSGSHAMPKTETPARNPKHAERRATPLAPLCLLLGVERTCRSGEPRSVDDGRASVYTWSIAPGTIERSPKCVIWYLC